MTTRWMVWFPQPPSALPPPPTSHDDSLGGFLASICPSTTTNESRRLVGGSLGFHLPFHHHQRSAFFTHYHVPATSHLTLSKMNNFALVMQVERRSRSSQAKVIKSHRASQQI